MSFHFFLIFHILKFLPYLKIITYLPQILNFLVVVCLDGDSDCTVQADDDDHESKVIEDCHIIAISWKFLLILSALKHMPTQIHDNVRYHTQYRLTCGR